jgi:hypothetical protein
MTRFPTMTESEHVEENPSRNFTSVAPGCDVCNGQCKRTKQDRQLAK